MKNNKTILVFFVLLFQFNIVLYLPTIHSTTQSFDYNWHRTWGGSGTETGNGVAADSSDNLYLVGPTDFGEGYGSMAVLKYDNTGNKLWNLTWSGSSYEIGFGVAIDSSDNVYVAGKTFSFGAGGDDMALVKYDNSGVQQWNRTWGGSVISNVDIGRGVAVDSLNNVYLVGYSDNFGAGDEDIVLVKFDSSGVQQWNQTWGGINNDNGYRVAMDSSDNVYLSGTTESFGAGNDDMALVKYDNTGLQLWNRTWGGVLSDTAYGVVVDSSDNVYLSGTTESFGAGNDDMILVKYDSSGVQLWNTTWGESDLDVGAEVVVDSFGNVYLGGTTKSFTILPDFILVKYDSAGTQIWNKTWGTIGEDVCHSVAVDSSDNVYLGGRTTDYGPSSWDLVVVRFGIKQNGRVHEVSGYPMMLLIAMIAVVGLIFIHKFKKKSN